jgi:hypothetical protein
MLTASRLAHELSLTHPRCGPFKLAYILNQCLDRFELPEENLRHQSSGSELSLRNPANNIERSSLPPTISGSPATESTMIQMMNDTTISDALRPVQLPPTASISDEVMPSTVQVLIVDDNAINRSVSDEGSGEQRGY